MIYLLKLAVLSWGFLPVEVDNGGSFLGAARKFRLFFFCGQFCYNRFSRSAIGTTLQDCTW